MIQTDEEALICDLAETYHIYDYRTLPARLVASFAIGLRENSRIKMKLSGSKVSAEIILLASIADSLNFLAWTKTKDSEKGLNRPKSILNTLTSPESEFKTFVSGEDFIKEREKLIRG